MIRRPRASSPSAQGEIVQPDVGQEAQARANLFDDLVRDLLLARPSARAREKGFAEFSIDIRVTASMLFAADRNRERLGFETRALAGRAASSDDMNFSMSSLT